MIRFALMAGLLLATAQQALAAGPRLKELVAVTSDVVRIGDLVDNAGPAAAIPVFRSPDLGETGAVAVSRIAAALEPHHIFNLDTGGLHEVLVTHLSRAIPATEIEQRLIRAFAGHYGFGDVSSLSIFTDRPLQTLQVEASATAELAISRVNVDPRSGRFDVTLELPGSAVARRWPLRITGIISETIEAAVLVHALARSDIIKADDFMIERRRKAELLNDAIPATQAVGLAVKRPMRVGELLRAIDLTKPEVVHRNQTVTIVYQVPGISLTVRGKALEAGAVGDLVSVTNIQSNRTVQATVQGPGRVAIAASVPQPVAVAYEPEAPVAPSVPAPPAAQATPAVPPIVRSPLVQTAPVAPTLSLPSVTLVPRTP